MGSVAFATDKALSAVSSMKNNLGYSRSSSSSGDSPQQQTLKLNRTFTAELGSKTASLSGSVLPREELKPLKGILVNQSSKSHDTTPISSPRNLPESNSSRTLPASIQKRNTSSSSTVTDFLKKFSPKLGRSKKSLQWYTVDIQPSVPNSLIDDSLPLHIENDPTIRELQNGRISSEFSSEMSECLSKNLSSAASRSGTVNGVSPGGISSLANAPIKPTDLTDFVLANQFSECEEILTSSKSMPATPVTGNQGPWRMMMVDIDIEKNESGPKKLRQEFFKADKEHSSPSKYTGFRMPSYNLQSAPVAIPLDSFRDHVPSYIKLSRALNGYSARNMYTSKKLVSSRDYNSLLCKSEEFLNRSTVTPPCRGRPTEAMSARGNLDPSKDYRRAASADRESSLLGRRGIFDIHADEKSMSKPDVEIKKQLVKPGHEFLQTLDAEVKILKELCLQGEKELIEEMPEEALEQLRSAIGKTYLLLTQKFEQFRRLCVKNIEETDNEPLKTTVSDLQGFWDMMSIQVCDVKRMFSDVSRLKSGEWKKDAPHTSNGVDGQASSVSGASSGTESPKISAGASGPARRTSKPKVTFQLNERDMQRKELIAAKRRAFEEMQQQQAEAVGSSPSRSGSIDTDAEVQIFMPTGQVN